MIYYLYKTTNTQNNKYYFGKRAYNGSKIGNDKYLGSGTLLLRAITKYGTKVFHKEILGYYGDLIQLNESEKELITEDIINDPLSYNIALGGHGGHMGEIVNAKIRMICRTPEYRKKMSDIINDPLMQKQIRRSIRKTMSDPEWKISFSKVQKTSQNIKERRLENSKCQKIAQNRPKVKELKRESMISAFENPEIRKRHKDGCNTEEFKKAQRENNQNTKWVHNIQLHEQKYIKTEKVQPYLDAGWEFGMLSRTKDEHK